jgi:Anti-sigma factor NepR
MLSDVSSAKKRPELTPEVQAKIGQQLRKIYDDMVTQGVPDRFVDLLDQLDAKVDESRRDKSGDPQRHEKPDHKHSSKGSR